MHLRSVIIGGIVASLVIGMWEMVVGGTRVCVRGSGCAGSTR